MRLFPEAEPTTEVSTYDNSRKTGFVENWSNALGLSMMEDLPITSRMIPTVTESQRNQKLYEYKKSGDIPENIYNFYGGDTDGLAGYARNVLGISDIPTLEEFDAQKLREYKLNREASQKTFAQQSKTGLVGEMAGRAHAMALDPLYATSFLTGYGSAVTIGQAALRVGLAEAGIETAAQLIKIPWKQEIGADYGAAQAMTEIAFAGLGSAALAGLGKAVGKAIKPKDLTVEQAVEVFEKMAKKDPEMVPVLNTLRQADPTDNLAKVMEADEAIDIAAANQGAKSQADVKGALDTKAPEFETAEEAVFNKRAGVEEAVEEGVPRGTPKIEDTRHPLVKEADDLVVELDDSIKVMEECF